AVHGRGAAGFARALRAHGVRAVTSAAAPTASWLRGAGLDAAVLVETRELVASDGTRQALGAELDAVSIIQMLQGG
nr:hypothetical protein [Myxococcota bacterium]